MTAYRDRLVSRRRFLRELSTTAGAAGALSLVGCGDSDRSREEKPPGSPTTVAPTIPTSVSPPGSWARIEAVGPPSPRRDHSLTYNPDEDLIYVFGGRAAGASNNELWAFDPQAATWRQFARSGAFPEPRFGHNAMYDASRKRLIIALGQGNGGAFFNDVWGFDGAEWTRLFGEVDGPEVRYGAGSAHDTGANRLVISHGFTDEGRYNDTWVFDLDSAKWIEISTSGAFPIKRCLTRCSWHQASQSMILFGGQTDDNPFLGDFWDLDVAGRKWSERSPSPLPGPRNLFGAALDENSGRWYITGGNTPNGPTSDSWVYDFASGDWSMLTVASAAGRRYSADATIAGGKLYVFGGFDGDRELNDTWVLPVT